VDTFFHIGLWYQRDTRRGACLGNGLKGGMVAAPLVPMAQDPYAWLKWVRYSLRHSHLGGELIVQLDGCTLGE